MILFFLIFFSLNLLVNYYLYRRAKQAFQIQSPRNRKIFFILFWFVAFSYPIARSMSNVMNNFIYDFILWIGSFWFAFMLYFFLQLLAIDIVRFADKYFSFLPTFLFTNYTRTKKLTAVAVILIASITIAYGFNNSSNVKVKTLEMSVQKRNAEVDSLNILFFADTHLTPVNNGRTLDKIVEITNSLNIDAVLLAGDVVDDLSHHLYRYVLHDKLKKIKTKFGVIMANGNHEWIVGIEDAQKFLRESKLIVLRDSVLTIANSLQVVGREDKSLTRYVNYNRKTIEQLAEKLNPNLPSVVLDHQPFELERTANAGFDMQLSGHTHHGQMFPMNLITSIIYEISWGYKKIGGSHFYVTSGVGTWGPPVRIGSDAELVHIILRFE